MQLRVVEVDDVQMGHDEETGRRTILVEPGVGGALVVTLWEGHAHPEVKEGDSLVRCLARPAVI